jgi:hypothetical protein
VFGLGDKKEDTEVDERIYFYQKKTLKLKIAKYCSDVKIIIVNIPINLGLHTRDRKSFCHKFELEDSILHFTCHGTSCSDKF